MKQISPDETYQSWCKRVELYEKGFALQQLANGEDVEQVMQKMAQRITKKMLHPLLKAIRESIPEPE
jgi:glutamyl-tRNA reductase